MKRISALQFRAKVWVEPIDNPARRWAREVWGDSMDEMLVMLEEFRLELQPGKYPSLYADFYTVGKLDFVGKRRKLGRYAFENGAWGRKVVL